MMVLLRLVFGLGLLAAIGCLAAWLLTGDARWKRRGIVTATVTAAAALVFFAVLIVERLDTLG